MLFAGCWVIDCKNHTVCWLLGIHLDMAATLPVFCVDAFCRCQLMNTVSIEPVFMLLKCLYCELFILLFVVVVHFGV